MIQENDRLGILNIYKRWERIFREGPAFIQEEFSQKTGKDFKKLIE